MNLRTSLSEFFPYVPWKDHISTAVIIQLMQNRVIFISFPVIHRSTFSTGLPFASSSASLSGRRIFCILGSLTVSACIPDTLCFMPCFNAG
jgi:hypothetical protein